MRIDNLVPVTEEHILELSETMIKEDREAAWALAHVTPEEAIRLSVEGADHCETWISNGRVGTISGVHRPSLLTPWAIAWVLVSPEARRNPREFLEGSKEWVERELDIYGCLRNYVDARHQRSIRWLKWLGYTIYPAEPLGIEGRMFHMNEIRK